MELMALVGGTPGIDCGGFCEFCYFKTVNFEKIKKLPIGCRNCPPDQIGCEYCQEVTKLPKNSFKPVFNVLMELRKDLIRGELTGTLDFDDLKINVGSWADILFYPYLDEILFALKNKGLPVHLGYTSGKGITHERQAENLISKGVNEVSFSVFSMNTEMRRKWMRDKSPEASLGALKIFCENIEVNASTVVIPGVINYEEIYNTCSILEDWGVKSFVLSRFANLQKQGLILNNRPVIDGIIPDPYKEFSELVTRISDEFKFTVYGSPATHPEKDMPYALSKNGNKVNLANLDKIISEATIVTSSLSAPFIKKILRSVDDNDYVNVIGVKKEVADLITIDDLKSVNLDDVKDRVVIPGGMLISDQQAVEYFSLDGNERSIVRGPLFLFAPCSDWDNDKEKLIDFELKSFNKLIDVINS